MTYESSLLGSHAANMATYALYVLVVFLVNNFDVRSEMEVVRLFFLYFGQFEWESNMITIYGAIKTPNFYDRLKNEFCFDIRKFALHERGTQDPTEFPLKPAPLFAPEDLQDLMFQFSMIRALTVTPHLSTEQLCATLLNQPRRTPNLKFVNILDPCLQSNNLGKSISLFNAHRLKEALKLQRGRVGQMRQIREPSEYFEAMVDFFKFTFEMCNVLPPLSIYLPQLQLVRQQSSDPLFDDMTQDTCVEESKFASAQEPKIDILKLLQRRCDRLREQLRNVQLSTIEIETLEKEIRLNSEGQLKSLKGEVDI